MPSEKDHAKEQSPDLDFSFRVYKIKQVLFVGRLRFVSFFPLAVLGIFKLFSLKTASRKTPTKMLIFLRDSGDL